jgi:putative transposase
MNRSIRKQTLFMHPGDYRAFIDILAEGVTRYDAPLVAYCVLNNHWHLLLGPLGKRRLSGLMHWVTTTHAGRWHRAHQSTGQGAVYQGRFTSTPLHDIASLVPMSRYVERNAKSAGLVDRAEAWPWCSLAQRYLGLSDVRLVASAAMASPLWLDYVNATLTLREHAREREQRASTVRGTPERPVPKTAKTVEKGSDPVGRKPVPTGSSTVRRSAQRGRLRRYGR